MAINLNGKKSEIKKAVNAVKDGIYKIAIPNEKENWDNILYIGELIKDKYPDKDPFNAGRWDCDYHYDNTHYLFIIDMSIDDKDWNCDNLVYDWEGYDWRQGSEIGWAVKGTPDYILCVQAYLEDRIDQEEFDDALYIDAWGWLPTELLKGTYVMSTEADEEEEETV